MPEILTGLIERVTYHNRWKRMTNGRRLEDGFKQGRPMRALTIRQPDAEAIVRGIKSSEVRVRPTTVRGRIHVYASTARYDVEQEAALLEMYGMGDLNAADLPHGVLIGTVELWDCTGSGGRYEWHFRNPERAAEPLQPTNRPGAVWFDPF